MLEVYGKQPAISAILSKERGPQGTVTQEAIRVKEEAEQAARDSADSAQESKRYAEDSARSAEESAGHVPESAKYTEESKYYSQESAETAKEVAEEAINVLAWLLFLFELDEFGDIMPARYVEGALPPKAFLFTFSEISGITVIKGIRNRTKRRIEC